MLDLGGFTDLTGIIVVLRKIIDEVRDVGLGKDGGLG